MRICAVIAEYNPFHNGHKFQLEKARSLSGADYVCVIQSGDFVQRGFPAVTDKYSRAKYALQNGADLVVELPVRFATGSGELFATGAVAMAAYMGADFLCFGSECGDLMALKSPADFLTEESDSYRTCLQSHLKSGLSFPAARQKTVSALLSEEAAALLDSPNNILAIEYLKVLNRLPQPAPVPLTVKRCDEGYHNSSMDADMQFCSATAVRSCLYAKTTEHTVDSSTDTVLMSGPLPSPSVADALKPFVPAETLAGLFSENGAIRPFPARNDFSDLLYARLSEYADCGFTAFSDVSASLSDKICSALSAYRDYDSFAQALKSKELTQSRIDRGLMHILLGIMNTDIKKAGTCYRIPAVTELYGHILGCRNEATAMMKAAHEGFVYFSSPAQGLRLLTDEAGKILAEDLYAHKLYEYIYSRISHRAPENEYSRKLMMIP